MFRPLLLAVAIALAWPAGARGEEDVGFASWTKATFERARRERRILVVTISTTWCHWCHVMKRKTYGDARVRRVLARRFLPVDVDADARPDLAERFRNYRWPTTAFLTPEGEPVIALRGYRGPDAFLAVLADVERRVARGGPYPGFEDPSAEGGGEEPALDAARLRSLRTLLVAQLDRLWDGRAKGWGRPQKYPVVGPLDVGLERGPGTGASRRAVATLRAMEALIDPVDGGMYQYSLEGRWDRWHPEKIMEVNAGALAAYADAYRLTGERRHLASARAIHRWLHETMRTPEGTYRTSQDADAPRLAGERYYRIPTREGRRRFGVPRTDDHVYARENGLAVRALARLHLAVGEAAVLAAARRAATRVLDTHARDDGALVHEAAGSGTRMFLLDQVEMGRGLLALHRVDPDPRWLASARRIAEATERHFGREGGGFYDATAERDVPGALGRRAVPLFGNARAARFLLALAERSGEARWRRAALGAIAAVSSERVVRAHGRYVGDLLVAVDRALRAAAFRPPR